MLFVVSCDPLCRYSGNEIRARIDATYPQMMRQTQANSHQFNWTEFTSPDDVGSARTRTMADFLDDYDPGLRQGRYVADELPALSFDNGTFDLALCSLFLFRDTDQLTEDFHFRAVVELSRVAREVRVFPLVALGGKRSRYVETVSDQLKESNLSVTTERGPCNFVRGAAEMMRVRPIRG